MITKGLCEQLSFESLTTHTPVYRLHDAYYASV